MLANLQIGDKRRADQIGYSKVFIPGEDTDGISYNESLTWLQQWYPARSRAILTNRRIILLVGTETYPEQFWSMKNNYWKGSCYLEWQLGST